MEIYNVKALVYKTLKSIPELKIVSPSYPDKFTVFPIAIYKTSQTSLFVIIGKKKLILNGR